MVNRKLNFNNGDNDNDNDGDDNEKCRQTLIGIRVAEMISGQAYFGTIISC